MTGRLRLLAAAAPLLAAAVLTLGSRCTDAAHSMLLHLGVIHADAGCASGAALGPSTMQLVGLTGVILISVLGSSAAVRDAIRSFVGRLAQTAIPVRIPASAPVSAHYSRRLTWGAEAGAGSRDPPIC